MFWGCVCGGMWVSSTNVSMRGFLPCFHEDGKRFSSVQEVMNSMRVCVTLVVSELQNSCTRVFFVSKWES